MASFTALSTWPILSGASGWELRAAATSGGATIAAERGSVPAGAHLWPAPPILTSLIEGAIPKNFTLILPARGAYWDPYRASLVGAGYNVVSRQVENAREIYRLTGSAPVPAVLLLIPDASLYDQAAISALLAAAYSRRIGVIGYTEASAKAGTVFSVICHGDGDCGLVWNAYTARSLGLRPTETVNE